MWKLIISICYCSQRHATPSRATSTQPCYACGSGTHQTPKSFDCPKHKCATCQGDLEPKGHNRKHCPLAQCESCKLTGHITDVCTSRQCYDVEIDYLNLLLLNKARSTIESYFDATDQAGVRPNALRIDGKFSESGCSRVGVRFNAGLDRVPFHGLLLIDKGAFPHKGSCKGTVGVRITRTRRWCAQTARPAIHPCPASPVLSCRSP